jgi:hypothetical protein
MAVSKTFYPPHQRKRIIILLQHVVLSFFF